MITKARHAVRQSLTSLSPGDHVLVAVSGGADSLLLAHCLNLEGAKDSLRISAVVIDHQLQERSGEIAEQTKNRLHKMGISSVEVIKVDVLKKDGLEADARSARYLALAASAEKLKANAIFLGHNQDDLAESVLLGLTQGAGTKSLAGMATQSGLYIRPFLSLTREEIIAACNEAEIVYWSDPHNDDERFTRVKIRKQILPLMESQLGPGIKEALARSARIFREDSDALETLTEEIFATISNPESIDVELLERLPAALRKRVIRRALALLGATRLSAEQLDWVDALISQWHGQGAVALPAGVTARRESGRLALSQE
jgi:tRNA(Ile)-lysidine synthase